MKIYLAPMDGLTDGIMRDILTRIGGIDICVTEFVRVTNTLLPKKVYYRACPELHHSGSTVAGVPVRLQLLGSDPECLADNAVRAAEMGAPGIDLNFGCPAKTVNRHNGGAALLTDPQNLYNIVKAVRSAVDIKTPVSAKMRLGYQDKTLALECAEAIEDAGASELVVHARTKTEGYRPPAYWDWIARIKEVVRLPVVANGEIWTYDDYLNCKSQSGCDDVMLGRGLISNPNLANVCKGHRVVNNEEAGPNALLGWTDTLAQLIDYLDKALAIMDPKYATGRLKQWLHYLSRESEDAQLFFQHIRRDKSPDVVAMKLREHHEAALLK